MLKEINKIIDAEVAKFTIVELLKINFIEYRMKRLGDLIKNK